MSPRTRENLFMTDKYFPAAPRRAVPQIIKAGGKFAHIYRTAAINGFGN
jgi:hypothetical protein